MGEVRILTPSASRYIIPAHRIHRIDDKEEEEEKGWVWSPLRIVIRPVVEVPCFFRDNLSQNRYKFAQYWLQLTWKTYCHFSRLARRNPRYYESEYIEKFNNWSVITRQCFKEKGLVTVHFDCKRKLWIDSVQNTEKETTHCFECKDAFEPTLLVTKSGPFSVKACKSVYHKKLLFDFTGHLRRRFEERLKQPNHYVIYCNSAMDRHHFVYLQELELLALHCWNMAQKYFRVPRGPCEDPKCSSHNTEHLLDYYHET